MSLLNADLEQAPIWRRANYKLALVLASPFVLFMLAYLPYRHAKSTVLPTAIYASKTLNERLQAGNATEAYASADDSFRRKISFESFSDFASRARTELGACRFAEPTFWRALSAGGGTVVTVTLPAQCEKRPASERLEWRIADGVSSLMDIEMDEVIRPAREGKP